MSPQTKRTHATPTGCSYGHFLCLFMEKLYEVKHCNVDNQLLRPEYRCGIDACFAILCVSTCMLLGVQRLKKMSFWQIAGCITAVKVLLVPS